MVAGKSSMVERTPWGNGQIFHYWEGEMTRGVSLYRGGRPSWVCFGQDANGENQVPVKPLKQKTLRGKDSEAGEASKHKCCNTRKRTY